MRYPNNPDIIAAPNDEHQRKTFLHLASKKNTWCSIPHTRELKSHEQKIVNEGQKVIKDKVKAEMHQAVVEVGTDICANVDEAYKDVSFLRKTISEIAESWAFGWAQPAHILSVTGRAS